MKLLSFLFILITVVSSATELTTSNLKMKMELDKSKPNYLVVNIVPDDKEKINEDKNVNLKKPNLKGNEEKIKKITKEVKNNE